MKLSTTTLLLGAMQMVLGYRLSEPIFLPTEIWRPAGLQLYPRPAFLKMISC